MKPSSRLPKLIIIRDLAENVECRPQVEVPRDLSARQIISIRFQKNHKFVN